MIVNREFYFIKYLLTKYLGKFFLIYVLLLTMN